jgi:Mrp family chromosome partitioning ATPase
MDKEVKTNIEDPQLASEGPEVLKTGDTPLVQVHKTLRVNPVRAGYIDQSTVSFHYYNSFNYSLLADQKHNVHLTLGVTSANRGEGKTLAASNLAVSLTLGYQRKTVLVDLNFGRPCVHKIFGAPLGPGLLDALKGGTIHVSPTVMENLFVLPAGQLKNNVSVKGKKRTSTPIGVEHTADFGEVIHSLEQEYDFVIVDMPAVNMREFPILFINQLEGVFVVIEQGKTKRNDIEKMFHHLNKQQVLGFVFNRVKDDSD